MKRSMSLMWTSGVLGYRALFAWNTPALFVVSLIVTPLLQVTFFVLLGSSLGYQDPAFFVIGNSIQVAAAAGISGLVSVIADERLFGTLTHILGSPGSKIAVFVGRILPGVVLGIFVALLTSLVGFAAVGWPISGASWGPFVVIIVVASFSSSALGLFLSALGLVYRDIYQIAGAAYLLMLVVSGANIARADLPGVLVWVGNLLPQTHSVDAARLLADGADGSSVWIAVVAELLVGGAWLLAGLLALTWLQRQARQRSTIEIY